MENLFIGLIQALGISPNAALIIGALIISNAYLIVSIAAMKRTLKIHGDHFEVLDQDAERAKEQSHQAMTFTYDILKQVFNSAEKQTD